LINKILFTFQVNKFKLQKYVRLENVHYLHLAKNILTKSSTHILKIKLNRLATSIICNPHEKMLNNSYKITIHILRLQFNFVLTHRAYILHLTHRNCFSISQFAFYHFTSSSSFEASGKIFIF
jgi:hypothetical protein